MDKKFFFAMIALLLMEARAADAQDPLVGQPLGIRLERNRVGTFPRRPFEWGRRAEFHRRKARDLAGIPKASYDDGRARPSVSSRSFIPAVVNEQQNFAADGALLGSSRIKLFQLQARSLSVQTLLLDGIGVSIDNSGQIFASGRLQTGGGPVGAWRGEKAIVEVRVFAGAVGEQEGETSAVIWSSTREIWVPRGEALSLSLLPESSESASDTSVLRGQFENISQVEVILKAVSAR